MYLDNLSSEEFQMTLNLHQNIPCSKEFQDDFKWFHSGLLGSGSELGSVPLCPEESGSEFVKIDGSVRIWLKSRLFFIFFIKKQKIFKFLIALGSIFFDDVCLNDNAIKSLLHYLTFEILGFFEIICIIFLDPINPDFIAFHMN